MLIAAVHWVRCAAAYHVDRILVECRILAHVYTIAYNL